MWGRVAEERDCFVPNDAKIFTTSEMTFNFNIPTVVDGAGTAEGSKNPSGTGTGARAAKMMARSGSMDLGT
jgi:hypothetical protein